MKLLLKKIERALRLSSVSWLRRFFSPSPITLEVLKERLGRGEIRKVVFIGTHQGLGQFLCATPLLQVFKEAWPFLSLHFLGNPVNAVVARANSSIDRVWVWKKASFWRLKEFMRLIRDLRRERYGLAMLLTTEMGSTTGLLLAWLSRAGCVAGYRPSVPNSGDLASLYHFSILYHHEVNEVDKFLGLGRALGLSPRSCLPELILGEKKREDVRVFLSTHSMAGKHPLVGLFLGGKTDRAGRLWPTEHFAQLAKSLRTLKLSWIAISPPAHREVGASFRAGENERLKEFLKDFGAPCPIFQEADLGCVAALLKELDLFICPDGGMMHLAAALRTPTLTLFFETDPHVWHHESKGQYYIDGRGRTPYSLSPETVLEKASEILRV